MVGNFETVSRIETPCGVFFGAHQPTAAAPENKKAAGDVNFCSRILPLTQLARTRTRRPLFAQKMLLLTIFDEGEVQCGDDVESKQ